MAEIINLRMARKAKARSEAGKSAAAARAQHGQSKAEKAVIKAEKARVVRLLDGARRED